MAHVYTAAAPGVTNLPMKCLIGVYNGVGSGQIIRVHRIWALNNQTVAITGIGITLEIDRLTTGSGGIPILPTKHDTSSPPLPSQVVVSSGLSYTKQVMLRQIWRSSDEPLANVQAGIDEWSCIPSVNILWDSYGDANIQPIVLREGYGVGVINTTITSTIGLSDLFIEFSMSTT